MFASTLNFLSALAKLVEQCEFVDRVNTDEVYVPAGGYILVYTETEAQSKDHNGKSRVKGIRYLSKKGYQVQEQGCCDIRPRLGWRQLTRLSHAVRFIMDDFNPLAATHFQFPHIPQCASGTIS
jgi:hypothetical protein